MALFTGAWPEAAPSRQAFIDSVYAHGKAAYRDLPWRGISDPYAVLVSEVMLQQTQVSRVLDRWQRFLERFPTVRDLALAPLGDVLEEWQGLGYNRRAIYLKRACEACFGESGGELPQTVYDLQKLPGIGPATAAGVVAFAYNRPAVYIETNVRAVFLHELFPEDTQVKDRDIAPLVADTCPEEDPRTWYYALLDYGALLKKQGSNPSRRSAQYARQSAFEGSHRQKRAEVLRVVLAQSGIDHDELKGRLDSFEAHHGRGTVSDDEFERIVRNLLAEGFFVDDEGRYYA